MAGAARRQPHIFGSILDAKRAVEIFVRPPDHQAHTPVELGGANVTGDAVANLHACFAQCVFAVGWMLERMFDEGRRVPRLFFGDRCGGLPAYQLRK